MARLRLAVVGVVAVLAASGCSRPVCESTECPSDAAVFPDAGAKDAGESFFACGTRSQPGTMDARGHFCRAGSFCWYSPWPVGNDLHALGGSSPVDVWAAGGAGTLFRFCGDGVLNTESGTEEILEGVWSASPSDAWAVGTQGTALHWNGTAWGSVEARDAGDLHDVWGASGSEVWLVGEGGAVYRWNGSTLARVATPAGTTRLWSVHGSAADDVWLSGEGSLLLHWDGQALSRVDAGAGSFRRVHAAARGDVWLAGSGTGGAGLLVHGDGGAFASLPAPPDGGWPGTFVSLWSRAPDDVWAGVGFSLVHWDGASAALFPASVGGPPYALWSPPQGGPLLVGSYVGWVQALDGGSFQSLTEGKKLRITRALWGSSASDVWAGASKESGLTEAGLLHFDGAAWSWNLPGPWIDDLHGTSATNVWAVGTDAYQWNGSTWTTHSVSFANNAVFSLAPNDTWSVGFRAKHWNGTAWTETPLPSGVSSLYAVWGAAANDVWAAGLSGTVVHWDGTAWKKIGDVGVNTLYSAWGSGKDDVYFVGDFGLVAHWNGVTLERLTLPEVAHYRRVTGTGPRDVWALGNFGKTFHFDGTSWSRVRTYSMRDPLAAWFTEGDGWIAGEAGSLMRWRP